MATIVLAAVFLGERISFAQMLGGAIILAAVIVLARYGDYNTPALRASNRRPL